MCGITGFWGCDERLDDLNGIVGRMADAMSARGPDDRGIWVDAQCGLALGHRRLAVLDLSAEGHQPMVSSCGRYVIVFNGEIYNFGQLKSALVQEGCAFRGHSDTEVLIEAIGQWGIQKTLVQLNGMFAFALWDHQVQKLFLVRDRLGIKPLYYGWINNQFVFASELKALWAHPHFQKDIQIDAVALLMHYGYIPAPHSIFRGIYKLLPGTFLSVSREHILQRATFSPTPTAAQTLLQPAVYWSAQNMVAQSMDQPVVSSDEALSLLHERLSEAVLLRMVADVPLGAFLSGGIDSSTIVALMQVQSARPVKTFSIGFAETDYNEAPWACAIARHLGTDHTELYMSNKEIMDQLPLLPEVFDEPFADSSQIPQWMISRLTRQHVTVCLSGDGGDELFCGYDRYRFCRLLWRCMTWAPIGVRRVLARVLSQFPERAYHHILQRVRQTKSSDKIAKLAGAIQQETPDALYEFVMSLWNDIPELMPNFVPAKDLDRSFLSAAVLSDSTHRMMFRDLVHYLPDDLLTKVDRASMGVGLEVRVPLLDHHVVATAWRMPLWMHSLEGQSKWPLRQILYRYVPRHLIDRPKMGFGVPIDRWLRGPLRMWAEDLLDEGRLKRDGYFDPGVVHRVWAAHLSGKRQAHQAIWCLLAFQTWLARFGR